MKKRNQNETTGYFILSHSNFDVLRLGVMIFFHKRTAAKCVEKILCPVNQNFVKSEIERTCSQVGIAGVYSDFTNIFCSLTM